LARWRSINTAHSAKVIQSQLKSSDNLVREVSRASLYDLVWL